MNALIALARSRVELYGRTGQYMRTTETVYRATFITYTDEAISLT